MAQSVRQSAVGHGSRSCVSARGPQSLRRDLRSKCAGSAVDLGLVPVEFEPEKFFVGLMDFFSILLPGALLTFLFMGQAGPLALGADYGKLAGAQGWTAFLFASYLVGHLIFLLGSWLDILYDWVRNHTLNNQIALVARRKRLPSWLLRTIVWVVFKRERSLAVTTASEIKKHAVEALRAKDAMNTFQWCKALLNIESSASLALVQRFEADSKFFRCLSVVIILVLVTWPLQHRWPSSLLPVAFVLLLLSLWRYMDQRLKSTNQAYWAVIALTAKDGKIQLASAELPPDNLTHAGGVVVRMRGSETQYLLVEATNDPDQWVLPKGHIEEREDPTMTAVREVHEEAGVWGCIEDHLHDVSYSVKGKSVCVRFYLMRALGRGFREDFGREHVWLPLQKAIDKARHEETRKLLKSAGAKLPGGLARRLTES